uniref:Phytanoyl-CoA dioxygenase n=1 Tax=Heterosigma akashiwo TaxID=2829 RepID=A0A6V1UDU3_HETAK
MALNGGGIIGSSTTTAWLSIVGIVLALLFTPPRGSELEGGRSLSYLSTEQVESFQRNGYLVVPSFWDKKTVKLLRSEIASIISSFDLEESRTIFSTDEQSRHSNDYFLGSGDKIRFFWEEDAFDDDGNFRQKKEQSINKIGHALHDLNSVFQNATYDTRVGEIARDLGLVKPLAVQSMYIFKQPRIGGKVGAHQDGAFLYTRPQSVLGFWWPLEDTSLANGCLWAVPGSHKTTPVSRRFKRDGKGGTTFDPPGPPAEFDLTGAVPLELKAGSLVLLHAQLVHYSLENRSPRSRHAYSVHAVDGAPGVAYPADNWLQTATHFRELIGHK